MFYAGNGSAIPGTVHMHIGYATSPDGIVWTRYGDWPVLSPLEGYSDLTPVSFVIIDGTYHLYYSMSPAENVWDQLGVATGTVTWE